MASRDWKGPKGVPNLQGWWAASFIVLWVLVLILALVVLALARQIGTLHLRLGPRGALEIDDEGPPLGAALPPREASDIEGRNVTIGGPGRSQLLLFVSPGCMVCEQVLPSIPAIVASGGLDPLVITDVDAEETRLAYRSKNIKAPLVPGLTFVVDYEVPGTPYVVVTDDLGIVRAKGTVNNLEQLEGLVTTALKRTDETIHA